jgi:predicted transcriptional regulator
MPKKRKPSKDDLGPGTFIRLDTETRVLLAEEAEKIERSMSWLARKLIADGLAAKKAFEPVTAST